MGILAQRFDCVKDSGIGITKETKAREKHEKRVR